MKLTFCRRSLAAFWLGLAVLAGVIWCIRLDSVFRAGQYYSTTGCEDISIFNISRMRCGDPVYADCFTYPYRISLFNWLFYGVHGAAAWLIGPSEVNLPTVLRLVTLSWGLLGFGAMVRFLWTAGPVQPASLERATALFLAVVAWFGPIIGWWMLSVRPDVPGAVRQLIGLFVVIRGGPHLSVGRALAAGVCFFLAWSFKQNAVGILIGTLLALLLQGEWSSLFRVTGVFAALAGCVLLLAGPRYFLNVFQGPSLAPFHVLQLVHVGVWGLTQWLALPAVGLAVLRLFPPGAERDHLIRSRPVFMLGVVAGATLVLNGVSALRVGSSTNYMIETWLVALTLTGLIQANVAQAPIGAVRPADQLIFLGFCGILFAFSCLGALVIFRPFAKTEQDDIQHTLRLPRPPYSEQLLRTVQSSPRPFLCDDPNLVRQALGSASDEVPIVDHTIYWDARRAGWLSQPDIVERLQRREYANLWLDRYRTNWERIAREAGYVFAGEDDWFRHYTRPPDAQAPGAAADEREPMR